MSTYDDMHCNYAVWAAPPDWSQMVHPGQTVAVPPAFPGWCLFAPQATGADGVRRVCESILYVQCMPVPGYERSLIEVSPAIGTMGSNNSVLAANMPLCPYLGVNHRQKPTPTDPHPNYQSGYGTFLAFDFRSDVLEIGNAAWNAGVTAGLIKADGSWTLEQNAAVPYGNRPDYPSLQGYVTNAGKVPFVLGPETCITSRTIKLVA